MVYFEGSKMFKFYWCKGHDLAEAQALAKIRGNYSIRLCYLTTERHRVYLLYSHGSFQYSVYYRDSNMWLPTPTHMRKQRHFVVSLLENEDTLKRELEFVMMLHYPHAAERYHAQLPSKWGVLRAIEEDSSTAVLDASLFIYYAAPVIRSKKWNGVIEVLCEDGKLRIPYKLVNGSKVLLPQCSKFHPDSLVESVTEKFFDFLYSVYKAFLIFRWSNIRHFVDSVGSKYEQN